MRSLLITALLLSGCYTQIAPGYVGVEVISCGDNPGVNPKFLDVGYHSTGRCTTIVEYPTFMQTAVWTHKLDEGKPVNEEITFTNSDQMSIAADISLAYILEKEKVPAFYSKFRADNLDSFTHGFLRNLAREKFDHAAGKYKIEAIMGDNSQFLDEVRDDLQKTLDPFGVKISQFGFVGAPRPPESIVKAINMKLEATQKAIQVENELRQSTAEAKKRVAQAEGEALVKKLEADAEAYSNQKITSSLTPTLVEYRKVLRWDGKLPQVSGGAGTLLQLK